MQIDKQDGPYWLLDFSTCRHFIAAARKTRGPVFMPARRCILRAIKSPYPQTTRCDTNN